MLKQKTFFLDQHGCAKNQVDGELMITRLEAMGLVRTDFPEKADLIIVNSCGFIESAKKESLDSVLNAKNSYPNAKILLAGCLAERYAKIFSSELPEADGIFGNGDISAIDSVVEKLFLGERPIVTPPQRGVCCGDRNLLLNFNGSAYVKITEGCDNHCTFCAIPLIRGKLRSRPAKDIVQEIEFLVHEKNIVEINLIGQDLAAYGCGKEDDVFFDGTNGHSAMFEKQKSPIFKTENNLKTEKSYLLRLLQEIAKIDGKFWVRLLYIHPDHFDLDILQLIKTDLRFLPYFDIPFQSGSTSVIGAMNRKGSAEDYISLVEKIKSEIPNVCIRTTFLTGFPGEKEENALETQEFLKKIQSDWSGCFSYSKEEDTPAARFSGKVPKKIALQRAKVLESIQEKITEERLSLRLGEVYDVLVEEIVAPSEQSDSGLAIGRTWFEAPEVDGNIVIRYELDDKRAVNSIVPGKFVRVKALSVSGVDIDGIFVGE